GVFGAWNSAFRRFSRWSRKGVWWRIFEAMSDDPDFAYLIVDSTIIRAHQHASGAKKGLTIRPEAAREAAEHQAAYGCARPRLPGPLRPDGGTEGRCAPQAEGLIAGLPAEIGMADTAYDSNALRQAISDKGTIAVIPNNPSRALKYPLDRDLYAQRHLVECGFSRLKQFRRVATRYEKTAQNYIAVITIAAIALWIR
ncbi:MAG: IS5 family transposase, partial [Paracoccus sp. (in: a-proteobacteria)]